MIQNKFIILFYIYLIFNIMNYLIPIIFKLLFDILLRIDLYILYFNLT